MASADARDGGDGDREFVRAAMRQPYLERERERELARRWRDRGDEAALHELVSAYVRLVVGIAGRFRGYGLPLGDLVQEGNVGLLQAAPGVAAAVQVAPVEVAAEAVPPRHEHPHLGRDADCWRCGG